MINTCKAWQLAKSGGGCDFPGIGIGIGMGDAEWEQWKRIWQHMGLCPDLTLSIEHHKPGGGSRLWLLLVLMVVVRPGALVSPSPESGKLLHFRCNCRQWRRLSRN